MPKPKPLDTSAFLDDDERVRDAQGLRMGYRLMRHSWRFWAQIASSPIVETFGGTYLVRAGRTLQVEGVEAGHESAMASGFLDFVLSPEDIAKAIVRIAGAEGTAPARA